MSTVNSFSQSVSQPPVKFQAVFSNDGMADYGLSIRDTTNLTIANLTFFACNVDAQSILKETYIDHLTFDTVDMLFAASSHRMLRGSGGL